MPTKREVGLQTTAHVPSSGPGPAPGQMSIDVTQKGGTKVSAKQRTPRPGPDPGAGSRLRAHGHEGPAARPRAEPTGVPATPRPGPPRAPAGPGVERTRAHAAAQALAEPGLSLPGCGQQRQRPGPGARGEEARRPRGRAGARGGSRPRASPARRPGPAPDAAPAGPKPARGPAEALAAPGRPRRSSPAPARGARGAPGARGSGRAAQPAPQTLTGGGRSASSPAPARLPRSALLARNSASAAFLLLFLRLAASSRSGAPRLQPGEPPPRSRAGRPRHLSARGASERRRERGREGEPGPVRAGVGRRTRPPGAPAPARPPARSSAAFAASPPRRPGGRGKDRVLGPRAPAPASSPAVEEVRLPGAVTGTTRPPRTAGQSGRARAAPEPAFHTFLASLTIRCAD